MHEGWHEGGQEGGHERRARGWARGHVRLKSIHDIVHKRVKLACFLGSTLKVRTDCKLKTNRLASVSHAWVFYSHFDA